MIRIRRGAAPEVLTTKGVAARQALCAQVDRDGDEGGNLDETPLHLGQLIVEYVAHVNILPCRALSAHGATRRSLLVSLIILRDQGEQLVMRA